MNDQPTETEKRLADLEELLLGAEGKLGIAHKVRILWPLLPFLTGIIGALLSWVLRDFLK